MAGSLEHLSPSDQYLFHLFGRGLSASSPFETVHAAIIYHAEKYPDAIAAKDISVTPAKTITYSNLVKNARYVANQLQAAGVQQDDRVPMVVRRSIEMLVGIVGVLMAGGQYVPLDGRVIPDKTLTTVLASSGQVALCTASNKKRITAIDETKTALILEELMEGAEKSWDQEECFTHADTSNGKSGCYVIYTSGTTGNPKGVDVAHSNVTNLLCNAPGNVGMRPGLRVGSVLSISFDMGAWEVLGGLTNGCTVVLRGSDWAATLREIDVLIATPTILSGFPPTDFPNIRFVATAGEPLPQRVADDWTKAGKLLFSGCGPTEVTIVNTIHVHSTGSPVSIGRPTPNNSVYVLDEDERPVPIGKPGVMWAGGAGITRGYVNLPEVTAKRWRLDPYAADGSYMFNTGDIGFWAPDGSLRIMGRQDDQVKIKGFRVELDGVATSLRSCTGVSDACALMVDNKLCAVVTPLIEDVKPILAQMGKLLPYYAVPSHCHSMPDFPKTNNGKIDKAALRQLLAGQMSVVKAADAEQAQAPPTAAPAVPQQAHTAQIPINQNADAEKNLADWAAVSLTTNSSSTDFEEKRPEVPLADKLTGKYARGLRFRIMIVYRSLFSIVWLANIAALIALLATEFKREWATRIAFINLTVAVLARQDHVINLLYLIFCSLPKSFPLWIRRRAAKIYHFGGMHSGSASVAVAWYFASLVITTWSRVNEPDHLADRASTATIVVSWLTIGLLFAIIGTAYPTFRKAYHDRFEVIHRFMGWSALGLIWVQTMLSIHDRYQNSLPHRTRSMGDLTVRTPEFWLLLVITLSIATSWTYLKKVPVDAEVLSDHAVRLHFDYVVPVNGSFTRLSHRPLLEWHSFATVPAPRAENNRSKGYSLVVSNAGDWTKHMIQHPPTSIYVRGVPTCGVMRIATLFKRLVIIGTGSGIGPLLGFIQEPSCEFRLIWSTRTPLSTFGPAMVDKLKQQDPHALIWDTKTQGRPDLVKLAWNEVKSFDAEAVIIIANEKITRKVVYGLETRGIPAFGAIWDS